MVNYLLGKVYKIQPRCVHEEGEIYIGSTAQASLCLRFQGHKYDYKNKNKLSVHVIFDKYGIDCCDIVLLERCPCETRDELFAIEAHYIQSMKCVNLHIMGRTQQQYRDTHKVEHALYSKNLRNGENRENILQNKRDYHYENRDKIKVKQDVYREANREQLNSSRREKVTCECGCDVSLYTIKRHRETSKHEKRMKELN